MPRTASFLVFFGLFALSGCHLFNSENGDVVHLILTQPEVLYSIGLDSNQSRPLFRDSISANRTIKSIKEDFPHGYKIIDVQLDSPKHNPLVEKHEVIEVCNPLDNNKIAIFNFIKVKGKWKLFSIRRSRQLFGLPLDD